MPLAKHEIAGTKGAKLLAEAPGYGRVDTMTGSMYWQIVLTDGTVDVINRHSLADRFFGTEKPKGRSALLADVKESRSRRIFGRGVTLKPATHDSFTGRDTSVTVDHWRPQQGSERRTYKFRLS